MKYLLSGVVFLMFLGFIQAQDTKDCWSNGTKSVKRHFRWFQKMYNSGQTQAAILEMEWLLNNYENPEDQCYKQAVKFYDQLQKIESDDTLKRAYQLRSLSLYDLRIERLGNEPEILNRKAYKAYQYFRNDSTRYRELYELFERVIQLNGPDTYNANFIAFIDIMRRYYHNEGISLEILLDKFVQVEIIIGKKIEQLQRAGMDTEPLTTMVNFTSKMMGGHGDPVDCDFIENRLSSKFQEDPDNMQLIQVIISLSYQAGCGASPLYLQALNRYLNHPKN